MSGAREPVIAAQDVTITDARGLSFQVVAGTVVPRAYVEAYEAAVSAKGKRSKAQRAPETDKAQRAPEASK